MAVPFTQRATEAIYNHSKELGDLISSNIALVAALGLSGRIKIITGGLGWRDRVFYGTDPNAGHRSRYTQIPTQRLENMTMAEYDGAFYSTSLVLNQVDIDEVKGDAALGDLVEDSWDVAKTYTVKKIGEDLWAGNKASVNFPIPLQIFVPATDTDNQTGTDRGGISSADNDWWRSQHYGTAIADIGIRAGRMTIDQEYNKCSRSSAKASQPDLMITTSALWGRLTSDRDDDRRLTPSDAMAKYGFEAVKYRNATVLWDAECPAKQFYILNTKKLKLKALKQPHMQNLAVNDKQLVMPMVITPFVQDIDTPNKVSLMYLKYQLTCNDVAGLGVLSNCTE